LLLLYADACIIRRSYRNIIFFFFKFFQNDDDDAIGVSYNSGYSAVARSNQRNKQVALGD
jgi:hypothetical protein